jgi:hypothetical protein
MVKKVRLLPVPTPVPLTPTPPGPLGTEGLALWNSVQSEFRVDDIGGVECLYQVCCTKDRLGKLAAQIDAEGEQITTLKNGTREHPLLKAELAARSFINKHLEKLGICSEPIHSGRGRPPGRYGY